MKRGEKSLRRKKLIILILLSLSKNICLSTKVFKSRRKSTQNWLNKFKSLIAKKKHLSIELRISMKHKFILSQIFLQKSLNNLTTVRDKFKVISCLIKKINKEEVAAQIVRLNINWEYHKTELLLVMRISTLGIKNQPWKISKVSWWKSFWIARRILTIEIFMINLHLVYVDLLK